MRYLILSDVHANAPALAAVVRDAKRRTFDDVVFLGDLVGYYPFPREVIAQLRGLAPSTTLLGNHDALLLALADGEGSTAHREESHVTEIVARQLDTLTSDDLEYLRSFALEGTFERWQVSHGAFRSPFEYLSTLQNARANLPYLTRPVGIVGHTHVPKAFASVTTADGEIWRTVVFRGAHAQYRLPPGAKAFMNPGAVGQPRDGSPWAAYALYDDERQLFDVHRVEYDIALVQQRVAEAKYPPAVGIRLGSGR
ncbi:metallophosphoesterase family protein [soil metagenome]|nr:metallophosphoesterase family protein [Trueperaceae bacterium]